MLAQLFEREAYTAPRAGVHVVLQKELVRFAEHVVGSLARERVDVALEADQLPIAPRVNLGRNGQVGLLVVVK